MMETTVVVDESGLRSLTNRSLGGENSLAEPDPLIASLAVNLRQSLKEAEERRDEQIALGGVDGLVTAGFPSGADR